MTRTGLRRWLGRAMGAILIALPLFLQACGGSASGAPPVSIPAPSPARLRVTSPSQDGLVTVTGSSGAVAGGNTVRVTDIGVTGATPLHAVLDVLTDALIPPAEAQATGFVEVTAAADGSFTLQIKAKIGDTLSVVQIDPVNGAQSPATQLVVPANSPPLGFSPAAVTVDGAGMGYAVGSQGGSGIVAVINLELNSVVGTFNIAANNPNAVDFNPANNKLIIADQTNNEVLFVDPSTPLAQNSIPVTGPQSVAVDTLTNRAVVGTTNATQSFVLINLATESILTTDPITNASNPGATYLGSPAVDAANGRAVVVSNFSDGSSQIAAVDLTVPAFTHFEVVPDSNLRGAAVLNTNQALASDAGNNRILFADLTGAVSVSGLAVGTNPRGVAVNGAGTVAFVANQDDHTISVIDIASRSVSSTQDAGINPLGVSHFDLGNLTVIANSGNDSVTILH